MTNQEFIKQIATYIKKHASSYGIKVYSPIIAQAILESAYGTSELAVNAHNYFGLKYRAGRCKTCIGVYNKVGSEQNADGSYSSSAMQWCKFADMENGVIGYFDFINISNYSNLKGVTDPRKYLENIKADGYATSLKYVDNLMAVIQKWGLTEYDTKTTSKEETKMSNSSLVSYTKLSPNHSGARTRSIDRITPHCTVGQLSAESICGCFTSTSRQASCNYGIGTDGRIALCVEEKNRSWCSSSNANDQRAVTIECASDMTEPYAMNSKVYASLIKLCVDICKRNGKTKLLWFGDKTKTLNYSPASNEMVITVHRWFANKSCPGNWLYARLGDLANQVTKQLGGGTATPTTPSTPSTPAASNTSFPAVPFTVQVLISDLNIRKGAGMNYAVTGKYTGKGTFTITEVKDGWGHLKSNAGWIYLKNASYVKIGSHVGGSSSSSGGSSSGFTPYRVRVTASALNIRKGAGTNYGTNGCIRDKGVYTIVGEATGKGATKWLKLKSGAGYIASDYTKKV